VCVCVCVCVCVHAWFGNYRGGHTHVLTKIEADKRALQVCVQVSWMCWRGTKRCCRHTSWCWLDRRQKNPTGMGVCACLVRCDLHALRASAAHGHHTLASGCAAQHLWQFAPPSARPGGVLAGCGSGTCWGDRARLVCAALHPFRMCTARLCSLGCVLLVCAALHPCRMCTAAHVPCIHSACVLLHMCNATAYALRRATAFLSAHCAQQSMRSAPGCMPCKHIPRKPSPATCTTSCRDLCCKASHAPAKIHPVWMGCPRRRACLLISRACM